MTPQLEVIQHLDDLRQRTAQWRQTGQIVGFVPTMGALHRGHLALVDRARDESDVVIVSIFVNPLQFGPQEDLARYPRQLERDVEACRRAGVDLVYAPTAEEMYPPGFKTQVSLSEITDRLCGSRRPGHFDGVVTVVTKLLSQVGPCRAVFGRKDYQQLKVIERLVRDLDLDATILGVTTVREDDGLALSSRNTYLSKQDRLRALSLPRGLARAYRLFEGAQGGGLEAGELVQVVSDGMEVTFDRIDYVEVCDPEELTPLPVVQPHQPALVAGAGWIGSTRLIDNVVLAVVATRYSSLVRVRREITPPDRAGLTFA